ncbi:Secreted repeat [compost metagenome]
MTRHTLTWMALLTTAALLAPGLAAAADPAMEKDGMLVDHKGMTLYTFDKDAAGESNCYDKCAQNWPPLMATGADKAMGDWTLIKRKDGSMQWAYYGKPLYTYIDDKKAGDKAGEGKGGVWHIAKPQ